MSGIVRRLERLEAAVGTGGAIVLTRGKDETGDATLGRPGIKPALADLVMFVCKSCGDAPAS